MDNGFGLGPPKYSDGPEVQEKLDALSKSVNVLTYALGAVAGVVIYLLFR